MRCKWLCLVLLTTGCLADDEEACARYSETYELSGEIKLASSAKSALGENAKAPVVLQASQFSTVIACSAERMTVASHGDPTIVAELDLDGPGKFEMQVHVQGYEIDRSGVTVAGFLDANEDGLCTPGELVAYAELSAGGREELNLNLNLKLDVELELRAGQVCEETFYF